MSTSPSQPPNPSPTNPPPKIFTKTPLPKPVLHPLTPEDIALIAAKYATGYVQKGDIVAAAAGERLEAIREPELRLSDMSQAGEYGGIEDVSMVTSVQWTDLEAFIDGLGLEDEIGERWMQEIRRGSSDAMAGIELLKSEWVEQFRFEDFEGNRGYDGVVSWVVVALEIAARSQKQTYFPPSDPRKRKMDASQVSEEASIADSEPDVKSETTVYLPKLKSIFVNYYDTENGLHFSEILPFASLPSLEKLEIFALSDEEDWVAPPGPPDTSFNIKHLKFPYSAVTGTGLGNFIACCPGLESLEFVTGGSTCAFASLVPRDLAPGLQKCKETLEKLKIIDTEGWEVDWCRGPNELEEFTDVMCSFHNFEKLEELEIMGSMVVGLTTETGRLEGDVKNILVESLPRSLKRLELKLCGSEVLEMLDALVVARMGGGKVPLLEEVRIELKPGLRDDEGGWEMVVERFEEVGVRLVKCISGSRKGVQHGRIDVNGVITNVTSFS